MKVKIVKMRSLVRSADGWSNTVDDGYFRYVTVDRKRVGNVEKFKPDWFNGDYVFDEDSHDGVRGTQIQAHTLVELKQKIAAYYQA